jgi:hypothetical protein
LLLPPLTLVLLSGDDVPDTAGQLACTVHAASFFCLFLFLLILTLILMLVL